MGKKFRASKISNLSDEGKTKMIKSFLIYIMVFGLNAQEKITSKLEIFDIYKKSRKVIYEYKSHFEAPNWQNLEKYFLVKVFVISGHFLSTKTKNDKEK